MNKRISIIIVCLFLSAHLFTQRLFVLWDKINDIPVSRASVYTICQGKVKSTFSDQQGRVSLDFTFDSLIISHINYQKVCVRTLPDTLFLQQMTRTLSDRGEFCRGACLDQADAEEFCQAESSKI